MNKHLAYTALIAISMTNSVTCMFKKRPLMALHQSVFIPQRPHSKYALNNAQFVRNTTEAAKLIAKKIPTKPSYVYNTCYEELKKQEPKLEKLFKKQKQLQSKHDTTECAHTLKTIKKDIEIENAMWRHYLKQIGYETSNPRLIDWNDPHEDASE